MKEAVFSLCGLCLFSSLCEQLLCGSKYTGAMRLLVGLEISRQFICFIERILAFAV